MSRLKELLRNAERHVMDENEREAQAVSFVFGQMSLSGIPITREQVRMVVHEMRRGKERGEI